MKLTRDNLHDFIRGAAILGTGGGGDPYVGRLMLEQELRKGADIEILDPDDISDDVFAINVFSMGAPTVFVEKIPNGPATVISMRSPSSRSAVPSSRYNKAPSGHGLTSLHVLPKFEVTWMYSASPSLQRQLTLNPPRARREYAPSQLPGQAGRTLITGFSPGFGPQLCSRAS